MKIYIFVFLLLFVIPSYGAMNKKKSHLTNQMEQLSGDWKDLESRFNVLSQRLLWHSQQEINQRQYNQVMPQQPSKSSEFGEEDQNAQRIVRYVCGD